MPTATRITPIHQCQISAASMTPRLAIAAAHAPTDPRAPTDLGGDGTSADLAVAVEVGLEALLDAGQQPGRHRVGGALAGDDGPQFGVEVERLEAVRAVLDVGADDGELVGGQLAVEERLQLSKGLVAVASSWSVPSPPRRLPSGRPSRVRGHSRTTTSASPFFPDAAETSPCRSGCRASRRSPCRRNLRRRPAGPGSRKFSGRSSRACLTSSSVSRSNSWSSAERLAASVSSVDSRL